MSAAGKYARFELERRFLLREVPARTGQRSERRIHDRYVVDTAMRLRRVDWLHDRATEYKLGHRHTPDPEAPWRMRHTSFYLAREEYDVLARLPANVLDKRRYTLDDGGRVYSVDVFDGPLRGLVLAELGAETEQELTALPTPAFAVAEVTADRRFTGGALAAATAEEAATLVAAAGTQPPMELA